MEVLLSTGLAATTPILLAALGGAVNRQAGVVNIALDGLMLVGAFVAVVVAWSTNSALLGVLGAAVVTAVVGWGFGAVITRLRANEVIAGFGFNIFVTGLLGYVLPVWYGQESTLMPTGLNGIGHWPVPLLSRLPFLGPAAFDLDPITYVSWLLVPVVWFFLYRTVTGVHMRATGANEETARAVGLPTLRLREMSTAIAGLLCGLGGAQLSLAAVQLFSKDMTAGRGFIALAAFYFGGAQPVPTALASFLFGLADAVSLRLQTVGLPDQVPEMVPYVTVVLALGVVMGARRMRAARAALAGQPAAEAAS